MTDSPVTPNTQTAGGLTPGTTFAGKFDILELLGEGGMSAVYKARHINMDRVVALKVLHPWVLGEGNAAQRFLREARAVSGLNHPNIVKIISFDVEAEKPYMAMELLQGGSLADYIKKKGRLPAHEAAEICLQSARALAHAHAAGILHRDIKPGNIMLLQSQIDSTSLPRVQLVDFGVAKLLDTSAVEAQKLTQTNSVIGTPFYMSPEQCEKQPLDARSDMYALGCVLYEMLSGEPPFQGDSPLAVMFNHIHEQPPELPKNVPTALNALVIRMLAKKPQDRLASMDEVVAVLEQTSAPLAIPRRKPQLRIGISRPLVVVGLVAITASCLWLVADLLGKQQVTEQRKRKAVELHKRYEAARQNDGSFAEMADILWDEAQAWGYPEGRGIARDSMDKMEIEFREKGLHSDEPYCEKTAVRTAEYIEKFHDQDVRWSKLLLQALRNMYTISAEKVNKTSDVAEKRFWNNLAKNGARRWMEKAAELNDSTSYVEALGARIDCGELQGDAKKVMLLASMQKLATARAGTQQNQTELNGGLVRCAQEMMKIDPDKALKIEANAVAGLQTQFGKDSDAALFAQFEQAAMMYDAGKIVEAKKLYDELLPKFMKSQDSAWIKRAIWTALALREHYIWDRHGTQSEDAKITRFICDKLVQLRATDKTEKTADATASEYSRLAQLYWLLNRQPEAMDALARSWAFLPSADHNLRLHLDSQQSGFYGVLQQWDKQNASLKDAFATIEKYHIENADTLSVFHQQACVYAANKNVPEGVKLIETRWRPLYTKLLAKKTPDISQAVLNAEDEMVKTWKSW